jgi:hypothetical protein
MMITYIDRKVTISDMNLIIEFLNDDDELKILALCALEIQIN